MSITQYTTPYALPKLVYTPAHFPPCRLRSAHTALASAGDKKVLISALATRSLVHMLALIRNSDFGYGSLAEHASAHGAAATVRRNGRLDVATVQINMNSSAVAALSTYLLRAVSSSSELAAGGPFACDISTSACCVQFSNLQTFLRLRHWSQYPRTKLRSLYQFRTQRLK